MFTQKLDDVYNGVIGYFEGINSHFPLEIPANLMNLHHYQGNEKFYTIIGIDCEDTEGDNIYVNSYFKVLEISQGKIVDELKIENIWLIDLHIDQLVEIADFLIEVYFPKYY